MAAGQLKNMHKGHKPVSAADSVAAHEETSGEEEEAGCQPVRNCGLDTECHPGVAC